MGIGALLEDGLGDTVRVSLTEDPEFEAPVAIALADRYKWRESNVLPVTSYQLPVESSLATDNSQQATANYQLPVESSQATDNRQQITHNPYEYQKRHTSELNTFIGGDQVPRVVIDISKKNLKDPAILSEVGYLYSALLDKYNMAEQSTDFVYLAHETSVF